MIEILKFVRAAVDKTGNNPALRHFRIRGGTIQANNGALCIQAPIPLPDLDCCPHAEQFIKAVSACEGIISMHLDAGKLIVKSGKFTAKVATCDPARFPDHFPSGNLFPVSQPILPILRKLLPFVAMDDRRKWACGVQFSGNSAVATNSIVLVESWMPVPFPVSANLPRDAVAELVRLKVEPTSLQVSPHAVTFHLPEGAFISASVMVYDWPDIQAVFTKAEQYAGKFYAGGELKTIFAESSKITPFADESLAVHFHNGTISNGPQAAFPASFECPFSPPAGIFRVDQLTALQAIVDRVGFGAYPAPVPFFGGENLRGILIGYQSQNS